MKSDTFLLYEKHMPKENWIFCQIALLKALHLFIHAFPGYISNQSKVAFLFPLRSLKFPYYVYSFKAQVKVYFDVHMPIKNILSGS